MPRLRRTPRQHRLQDLLKEGRIAAGLSQEEVGRLLNLQQSFVSKLEQGERRLSVLELIDICEAIGTDPHHVIDELLKVAQT